MNHKHKNTDPWRRNQTNGGKIILWALVCVCAVLLVACEKRSDLPGTADAALSVSSSHIDLGGISEGSSKFAKFKVTNRSITTAVLRKLSSSCGCTSISITTETLPPGASAEVVAEMSNYGRYGTISSLVSLDWSLQNEEKNQILKMSVTANAEQVAIITPNSVDFGAVRRASPPKTIEIDVRPGNTPINYMSIRVQNSSPLLESKVKLGSKEKKILVTLDPQLPIGYFGNDLSIEFLSSSNERLAIKKIPIRAKVTGSYQVTPASIYLGVIPQGAQINGELTVSSAENKHFKIGRINVSPADATFAVRASTDSERGNKLRYTFTAQKVTGSISIKFVISLLDENLQEEVLGVPIIGYVKAPEGRSP